jgi:3-oxoacyl-[acyl-carrier protein] reductase
MGLLGKTALITGGSRGIGAAIAVRFAGDGADIVVGYTRDADAAQTVVAAVQAIGRRAAARQADISNPASVRGLFAHAHEAFGTIDIVVAYAGVELIDVAFTDYTETQYDQVFDVNVEGTFLTLQEAARIVPDGGRIVVVSSNTARLSLSGFAVYGAIKLATHYFVQVLANALGPRRVTVNAVIPGATRAAGVFPASGADGPPIQELIARAPLGRLGTPEDTAGVVAFLAGDDAGFISGQRLTVDGGAAI